MPKFERVLAAAPSREDLRVLYVLMVVFLIIIGLVAGWLHN
jgi:hypothetical protein